jgi:hypothetical protein
MNSLFSVARSADRWSPDKFSVRLKDGVRDTGHARERRISSKSCLFAKTGGIKVISQSFGNIFQNDPAYQHFDIVG